MDDSTGAKPMTPIHRHLIAGGVVALVLVTRLAAILALPDSIVADPGNDPDSYVRFGRHWFWAGVYGPDAQTPSAYRPPLYPIVVAPWTASDRSALTFPWVLAAIHLAASVVTLVLTWQLARQAGAGKSAWIAATLFAIDPLSIRQAALVMSETLFTTLLTALLVCWNADPSRSWRRLIGMALLLALASWTRPTAWAVWMLLGIDALWRRRFRDWLFVLVAALLINSPWVIRNWLVLGRPILTTTHGGYTLWLANNPVFARDVVLGSASRWEGESFDAWTRANDEATANLSETERDQWCRRQAINWLWNNSATALAAIAHHVGSLWTPSPRRGSTLVQWGIGIFYLGIYGLALVGLAYRGGNAEVVRVGLMVAIAFTMVHAVYWSDARMRTPIVPFLATLASLGVAWIREIFRPKEPDQPANRPAG